MSGASHSIPRGAALPNAGPLIRVNLPAGEAHDGISAPPRSQLRQTWDSFRSHKLAFIGLCIVATMVVASIVLPFVLVDPEAIDMKHPYQVAPSMSHPMGTDEVGRDMLSRVVSAGRISLLIGFMVAVIAATIGSIVGVAAGYFGGITDTALMWFVNVLMTIPGIPLLIAMAVLIASPESKVGAIFGAMPTQWRIIFVMSSLGWLGISRLVRSQVISLREQEFCEAAMALGAKHTRIMFIHILPNSVSVIAVFTTLAVSGAIIGESTLSYLGLGVQPPTASWGNMLSAATPFSTLNYPWTAFFPALAILVTVLAVNFIGDGVRDALDPKSMKK